MASVFIVQLYTKRFVFTSVENDFFKRLRMMVRAAGFEPAVCPAKDSALEAVASTEFRHARE